jgi:hypothetical protein
VRHMVSPLSSSPSKVDWKCAIFACGCGGEGRKSTIIFIYLGLPIINLPMKWRLFKWIH